MSIQKETTTTREQERREIDRENERLIDRSYRQHPEQPSLQIIDFLQPTENTFSFGHSNVLQHEKRQEYPNIVLREEYNIKEKKRKEKQSRVNMYGELKYIR